jgi:hypothetical protein
MMFLSRWKAHFDCAQGGDEDGFVMHKNWIDHPQNRETNYLPTTESAEILRQLTSLLLQYSAKLHQLDPKAVDNLGREMEQWHFIP